ncbi:MAG TPA: lytic murein transglycosylase, partial [Erythrobacter sp.]|nr:lytic murein transglycosylase [Erythrobacter sp.]
MKFKPLLAAAGAFALALPAVPATAQQDLSFDAYVQLLIAKARAEGVSEATLARMTAGLEPNDRVIRLDRAQPGSPTSSGYPALAPYIARHVDAARIRGGRSARAEWSGTLRAIERDYGVPGEIVVAIWGHETAYGA